MAMLSFPPTLATCVLAGLACTLISCGGGAATDAKVADLEAKVARLEATDPSSTASRVDRVLAVSERQTQQIAELNTKVAALETATTEFKSQKVKAAAISQQVSPDLVPSLQKVIRQCVEAVHSLAPSGATPMNDVHTSFDAYYNPATGRVVNNNQYVSQEAVYSFNKCMSERGWPMR